MTTLTLLLPRCIHLDWVVRKFNSFTCILMNGGHEFYLVRHEGGNLRQRCLLCNHETKGFGS